MGRWNQLAQLASIHWYISHQLGPWNQWAQLATIGYIAPIGPVEPIGPIGINSLGQNAPIGPVEPIGPIGIHGTYRANWAGGTNWSNWHKYYISRQLGRLNWHQYDISRQLGRWNQLVQLATIHLYISPVDPIGPIGIHSTYRANWARGTN